MNDFKWSYDGTFYSCHSSAGVLLHRFSEVQLEMYRSWMDRIISAPLQKELKDKHEAKKLKEKEEREAMIKANKPKEDA